MPVSSPHFPVHPHPHSGSCRVAQVSHGCQWLRGIPFATNPLRFGGCLLETPFLDAEHHLHCEEAAANCKQSPKSRGEGLVPCPLLLSEAILAAPLPQGVSVSLLTALVPSLCSLCPSSFPKETPAACCPQGHFFCPFWKEPGSCVLVLRQGWEASLLSLLRSP